MYEIGRMRRAHSLRGSIAIDRNLRLTTIGQTRETCRGGRHHGLEARIVAETGEVRIHLDVA